jgi:hypothetical protein
MKVVLALALVVASVATASAQFLGISGTGSNPNSHYVQPHVTSNGSITSGHYQLGMQRLIASCLNDACRHTALVALVCCSSSYIAHVARIAHDRSPWSFVAPVTLGPTISDCQDRTGAIELPP